MTNDKEGERMTISWSGVICLVRDMETCDVKEECHICSARVRVRVFGLTAEIEQGR